MQNDLSNGIVGFADDSKSAIVNEDTSNVVTLKLTRTNAFYGEIEVTEMTITIQCLKDLLTILRNNVNLLQI